MFREQIMLVNQGLIAYEKSVFTEYHIINYSFSILYLLFEKVIKSHGMKVKSFERLSTEKSSPNHPVFPPGGN